MGALPASVVVVREHGDMHQVSGDGDGHVVLQLGVVLAAEAHDVLAKKLCVKS